MSLLIDNDRIEFQGIEVIFTGEDDPRGSVWIEFTETLSLLYGKNGAGKSTILRAITAFVEGESLEDEGMLVHGYARVLDPSTTCSIMDQSISSMSETSFLKEWEELETSEVSQKFDVASEALDLPHRKWESSLFSAVPESIDDLDMDWNKYVSHFLFLGLWENDCRYDFAQMKLFIQHLISERTFRIRPTGEGDDAKWEIALAARLDNEEVRAAYEQVLADPPFLFFDQVDDDLVSQILIDTNILSRRADMPRTSSPFVSASRIAGQQIGSLGLAVVDLNEELDLEEWTKRRISEVVHSSWIEVGDPWFSDYPHQTSPTSPFMKVRVSDESVLENGRDDDGGDGSEGAAIWSVTFGSVAIPAGRTIEFQFTGERYEAIQRVLTFIAGELPEELAITDLRLGLAQDLGLWMFNAPGSLEAFDQRSGTWIPVSSTSQATQKIIGMALKIHADIRSSDEVVIAVGDEIDQGLHTLAVSGLYKMLADSIPSCFVATHSPIALSSRRGERLHVHRGAEGEVLVSRIATSDFVSSSAMNLGVRVNELIGMIDLVVAVEGMHDKLVLEHFIKQDVRLLNTNVLVISMTGVNSATNLIDAEFILSFTDLRILAVADNTSRADLQATSAAISQKLRAGQSSSKITQSLRARAKELRKQRWHEQRCMIELLAGAVERGLQNRLLVSGHTYADIEMALDPKFFGLDGDWLTLEADFKEYKSDASSEGQNFKDFLRSVHRVSIDQRSISAALSMTHEIPLGIKPVLDDIVTFVLGTDLLQELP